MRRTVMSKRAQRWLSTQKMEAITDLGGTVVAGPVLKAGQQRAAKRIQLLLPALLWPLAHV